MKIACLGGGPTWRYFTIWLKLCSAEHEVTVFERNRPPRFARRAYDEALVRARSREHFGGDGVVSGTPVERLHREIRPLSIYERASEIQKILLARHELRKSRQGSTYQ